MKAGDVVWISGQVGMEGRKQAEGLVAQTQIAFRSIERVLAEAGGTLADVVELVSYHIDMGEMASFAKVKDEFFPDNYPAWT